MTSGAGGMRLQDAARGAKRGLILSEAIRLFNQHGYFDTRLEDVAARLSTAKTSVSYHFKSKEALLVEAYNETCAFAESILSDISPDNSGLQCVEHWLRGLANAYCEIAMGQRAPLATINDIAGLSTEDRNQITTRMQAVAGALTSCVEKGVADGSMTVSSVEGTAFFLLNSPQWMPRWLAQIQPSAHREAVDAMIDIFLHGLLKNRDSELLVPVPGLNYDSPDFLFDRDARNKMKVEAFLRAGTRNFNRKGYANLALSDVTDELGVSRGSFYYYMDDKDALLRGCVNRTLEQIEQAFEKYSKRGAAIPALFNVTATIYQGHVTDLDPLLRLPLFEALSDSDRRIANARLARIRANFDEMLAMGLSDDSGRSCAIDAIGEILLGAIYGATRQRLETFGIQNSSVGSQWTSSSAFFEPLFRGVAAEG